MFPTLVAAAKSLLHAAASVHLLFPVWQPRQRQEERGPVHFIFLFLRFCFCGGIEEVVLMMSCSNKVSPASLPRRRLIRRRLRACESLVARYVGSPRIMAVGVSEKLVRFIQHFVLVVVDCKLVLRRE